MSEASDKQVPKAGFVRRMRQRLNDTDSWLSYDLANLMPGSKIEADTLEELETRLLMADVGLAATQEIIDAVDGRIRRKELETLESLLDSLEENIAGMLAPSQAQLVPVAAEGPFVILVVGVNGAGKTTTIAKLAGRFLAEGRSVMLAAGDTFRAAAVEQLQTWGDRHGVPVMAQGQGADSASVAFDAYQSARARGTDVLLVDTAGRLHTQDNLMEELRKVRRVLGKIDAAAPHETLLVLDANQGQNALSQAREFTQAVEVSGVAVTKLDGSAKGGILIAIAREIGLPVRYIGIGEGAEDLGDFDAHAFARSLVRGAA